MVIMSELCDDLSVNEENFWRMVSGMVERMPKRIQSF